MKARFWTWENGGWVKITLAPGQSLKWSKFSRDEEGWSSEAVRWSHEGTHVVCENRYSGKDCDGTISRGGSQTCPLSRLATVPAYDDGERRSTEFRPIEGRPDWQEGAPAWQRDARAELANY